MTEVLIRVVVVVLSAVIIPLVTTIGVHLINLVKKKFKITEYNNVIDLIVRLTNEQLDSMQQDFIDEYLCRDEQFCLDKYDIFTELVAAIKEEINPNVAALLQGDYADIDEFLKLEIIKQLDEVLRK